jgi:hypothetical protein
MNSSGDLAIEDPSESTSWPGLPEGLGLGTDSSHCPGILRMDSYDFIVFFFLMGFMMISMGEFMMIY